MINIIDKSNTYISKESIIGDNVTIYPNVYIDGNSNIGESTIIYPGTFVKDCSIGKNCIINNSQLFNSKIGNNCKIGPYAYIHDNVLIDSNVKIGSFVELKNTKVSSESKISHLNYIGDAVVGNKVNIGAGAITANYNGITKEKTTIEDNAFIGVNVNLIAPIKIGNNSLVAAGSTITEDVPSNTLAISRGKQQIKEIISKE